MKDREYKDREYLGIITQKHPKDYLYADIHGLVLHINSSVCNPSHFTVTYSFVEKCLSDYAEHLGWYDYRKISFHTFLFERVREYWKKIYPYEKDGLWLVRWSDDVKRPEITKDKNGKEIITYVHVLGKFEPFIVDINNLNQGWRGRHVENLRKYLWINVDISKKEMLESILVELKELKTKSEQKQIVKSSSD